MMKYQKILAVIDPEDEEQKSLMRAIEIAQITQALITAFLPIYDLSYEMTTMLSTDERENMRFAVIEDKSAWLAELVAPIEKQHGIKIDLNVEWHNRAWESIICRVMKHNYDLIVKGTQLNDTLKAVIFTPTDWHIMRKSPVPVLLVKDHDWPIGGKVLGAVSVGVEDDDHVALNDCVTRSAKGFAGLLSSEVHLVNAYPGTPVNIAIEIPEFDPQVYSDSVKDHHHNAMLRHAQKHEIPQNCSHIEEGLPEDVIPALAEKIDAELVVLGTVGRQGISGVLIGNTAEHVIDKLNCDVLAIKPDGYVSPVVCS
ncbi:MAG: universal stress protein UspE [Alteromonadaceae bacterium]|uniref:universal stress protein UspE n=1 Tax=Paraglaciecola chathamensis TaxID=368405 RepID=UPI000C558863|nr:universal stress protein UspE [Paraglaciecola agarilytica]MBN26874.1 universal stress protein UspE [Alteromonadaceae bacterium]|tara:strand:- start:4058 stop:4993 length:936 start_codon:yes stop_codon:yes gene_type:complete